MTQLFEVWIVNGVHRKDSNAELKRSFEKDVLPEIGALPVSSATEHDLRQLLRRLGERGVNRLGLASRWATANSC